MKKEDFRKNMVYTKCKVCLQISIKGGGVGREAVQVSYIHPISAPEKKHLDISEYRQEVFSYLALDCTYCPEI